MLPTTRDRSVVEIETMSELRSHRGNSVWSSTKRKCSRVGCSGKNDIPVTISLFDLNALLIAQASGRMAIKLSTMSRRWLTEANVRSPHFTLRRVVAGSVAFGTAGEVIVNMAPPRRRFPDEIGAASRPCQAQASEP